MNSAGLFDIVPAEVRSSAIVSPCGTYRYWLERGEPDAPYVAWVLANPSTADATVDDPTVRKARGFTERWGFKRFVFVNVFAYRSTDPKGLIGVKDCSGPENNAYIDKAVNGASKIVLAWGNAIAKPLRQHAEFCRKRIAATTILPAYCLGRTTDGSPRHPLMLAYSTELEPFA